MASNVILNMESLLYLNGRSERVKNRLEEIHKQRRTKQEELANALEVSRQIIGSLENGRYNPSIILAFKIARYFEMSIEEIFPSLFFKTVSTGSVTMIISSPLATALICRTMFLQISIVWINSEMPIIPTLNFYITTANYRDFCCWMFSNIRKKPTIRWINTIFQVAVT